MGVTGVALDATQSHCVPSRMVTPRPVPTVVAVGAPGMHLMRDPSPAMQRRPSSPSQCHIARNPVLGSARTSDSPLPTARVHRRPSSPHQASAPLSLVPSNASFTPQPRVLVGSANVCDSARASPMRCQGHVQSAPCIAGTAPATARLCSSQVHFGQVLQQQDMVARAAQKIHNMQFQGGMPSARGPIRVGAVPANMMPSPRVAG